MSSSRMRQKLLAFGFLVLTMASARSGEVDPVEHFEAQVRPLLNRECVKCHGADKQKADLRLDSREAALKGGDAGPALVPSKPQKSPMFLLIRHSENDRDRMPPKEKLAEAEIAAIEKWIESGAPWPDRATAPVIAMLKREA